MFKDRVLDSLKQTVTDGALDGEISRAIEKIENKERLSSQEFLKVYDTLWKEGAPIKYQNPDGRTRQVQSVRYLPDP